jgi:hypothetical protein
VSKTDVRNDSDEMSGGESNVSSRSLITNSGSGSLLRSSDTRKKNRVFGREFIMAKLRNYMVFVMKRVQEIVRNCDNHLLVIEL